MIKVYDKITIADGSLQVMCFEMQRLIQDGYEIDPELPPSADAIFYEVGMRKGLETVPEAPKSFNVTRDYIPGLWKDLKYISASLKEQSAEAVAEVTEPKRGPGRPRRTDR